MECPAWFIESFSDYVGVALTLNWNRTTPDYSEAAVKFWRDLLDRQRFPTPERPSFDGNTGERPMCEKHHGAMVVGPLSDNLRYCPGCHKETGNGLFVWMDGKAEPWAGP